MRQETGNLPRTDTERTAFQARIGRCGIVIRRFPGTREMSGFPGFPVFANRVVQGVLKPILKHVSAADFQEGSYGFRPGRTAHEAVNRVADGCCEK